MKRKSKTQISLLVVKNQGDEKNTTLGVDKDQDVMEVRLGHAEENYDRLRLDSENHSMDTCPVCMHMKLGSK